MGVDARALEDEARAGDSLNAGFTTSICLKPQGREAPIHMKNLPGNPAAVVA
jgi:hypothetical protein